MVQYLFDRFFASSVVKNKIACNIFKVHLVKRRLSPVCFVERQSLGYRGSWPILTLSHYILVWWCAEQVHPGVRFTSYVVLSFDVVITDQEVAKVHESALGRLGVTSYVVLSFDGPSSVEFAKRFKVMELRKYLSPI